MKSSIFLLNFLRRTKKKDPSLFHHQFHIDLLTNYQLLCSSSSSSSTINKCVCSVLLTFQMGYFLLTAQPHNNTVCNRPSILRLRVVYFLQTHCHYRRGMCTDGACGTHAQHDYMELSQGCHCIAIHGMIFPNFHHLLIIHSSINPTTRARNEKKK